MRWILLLLIFAACEEVKPGVKPLPIDSVTVPIDTINPPAPDSIIVLPDTLVVVPDTNIVVAPDTIVVTPPPPPRDGLIWEDRRPIGMIMLASFTNVNGTRNWKFSGDQNITSFKKQLFAHANESLRNLKEMNAQGMITWDIEGQQFFHPVSYLGDPINLKEYAPEIDSVADEYFKLFSDAGFKTGICIRPDTVIWHAPGGHYWHNDVYDPAANLIRKIAYAKSRWGCTIFYVDSNVDWENKLLSSSIFKKVSLAFPDCLIIPEWEGEQPEYWKYCAPLKNLYQYRYDVSPNVKLSVPNAFMVLYPGDAQIDKAQLKQSVNEGNIILFRAWYSDPSNEIIKQAYAE